MNYNQIDYNNFQQESPTSPEQFTFNFNNNQQQHQQIQENNKNDDNEFQLNELDSFNPLVNQWYSSNLDQFVPPLPSPIPYLSTSSSLPPPFQLSTNLNSISTPTSISPSPTPLLSTPTPIELIEKRLPSCSACRVRRVKCVRTASALECSKCLEKGWECVPMPKNIKKSTSRNGKRIEQVQALFGKKSSTNDAPSDGSKHVKKRKLVPPDLSNTSVVARLVTSELEGALSASLIDLYYKLPQSRIPILEGLDFRTTFDKAGRRISQMESQAEVLCSVIFSIAARVSSHPLLIGANPPTSQQIMQAHEGYQDLSEYGRKREGACIALTKKSMSLADSRGTMRVPSLESVGTLMLLEGLAADLDDGRATERAYANAYLSHIRYLLEHCTTEEERVPLMDSGIGWICYVKDAFSSASTGAPPSFNEDDIPLLRRASSVKIPPLADLFNIKGELIQKMEFWPFFHAYLFHLTSSANLVYAKFTSPRARRNSRIDLISVQDLLTRIDQAVHATPFLVESGTAAFGPYEFATDEGKMCLGFLAAMNSSRYRLAFLLYSLLEKILGKRSAALEKVEKVREIGGRGGDEVVEKEREYWREVERFYKESLMRATDAAREVVADLRKQQEKKGLGVGIMSGIHMLYNRLVNVAMLISRHPTFEEPGGIDPTFTYAEKLSDLKVILTSLYTIGFSFPKLSSSIPSIQAEIDKVTLAQFLHQYDPPNILLDPTNFSNPILNSAYDEFDPVIGMNWKLSMAESFPNTSTSTCTGIGDSIGGESELEMMLNSYIHSTEVGSTNSSQMVSENSMTTTTRSKEKVGVEGGGAQEVDEALIDLLSNLLR